MLAAHPRQRSPDPHLLLAPLLRHLQRHAPALTPTCSHDRTSSCCTSEADGLVQDGCDSPMEDEPIMRMPIRSCRICAATITDTTDGVCAACARDEQALDDQELDDLAASDEAERRAELGPQEISLDPERPINAVRPDTLYGEGPPPRRDFID